jgi:hypothetical protein
MEKKRINVKAGDKFYLVSLKESEGVAFAWAVDQEELMDLFISNDIEILYEINVTEKTVDTHNRLIERLEDEITRVSTEYGIDKENVKECVYKEVMKQIVDKLGEIH